MVLDAMAASINKSLSSQIRSGANNHWAHFPRQNCLGSLLEGVPINISNKQNHKTAEGGEGGVVVVTNSRIEAEYRQ